MSMFDSMMRQGGAPTLMAGLGTELSVVVKATGIEPFTIVARIDRTRGQSQIQDLGIETKLETKAISVLRSDLEAKGITSIPVAAKIEADGDTRGWAIRLGESEWGAVWVKLGLEREILIRKWQAQNNAAV